MGQRFGWLAIAALVGLAASACGGTDVMFVPVGAAGGGAAGSGGGGDSGAVAPDAGGAGGSGGSGSTGPDAGAAPDVLSDATGNDVADGWGKDAPYPDAVAKPDADAGATADAAPDAHADIQAPPEAGNDAGSDVRDAAADRWHDADGAVSPDATDGSLPPTCDYWIEPVPEATWPHALCGTTTAGGSYQFSRLRFRRPISTPGPIDEFSGGTMTVRNGSTVTNHPGQMWRTTMGEEVAFSAEGGASIFFTTGANEISVTSLDKAGKRGCLPQPCTWTVMP